MPSWRRQGEPLLLLLLLLLLLNFDLYVLFVYSTLGLSDATTIDMLAIAG
jgi:hypothetical protein